MLLLGEARVDRPAALDSIDRLDQLEMNDADGYNREI